MATMSALKGSGVLRVTDLPPMDASTQPGLEWDRRLLGFEDQVSLLALDDELSVEARDAVKQKFLHTNTSIHSLSSPQPLLIIFKPTDFDLFLSSFCPLYTNLVETAARACS